MSHTDIPDDKQGSSQGAEALTAQGHEADNLLQTAIDMAGNEFAMGYDDSGCFWHFQYGIRGAGRMIDGCGDSFSSESADVQEALQEFINHLRGSDLVLDDQEANTDATNPPDQTSPSTDEVEQMLEKVFRRGLIAADDEVVSDIKMDYGQFKQNVIAEAKAAIQAYARQFAEGCVPPKDKHSHLTRNYCLDCAKRDGFNDCRNQMTANINSEDRLTQPEERG